MDVFLSEDALLLLRAHALEGQGKDQGGLLLGHKRGQRFIVEQVILPGGIFSLRNGSIGRSTGFSAEKSSGFIPSPQARK